MSPRDKPGILGGLLNKLPAVQKAFTAQLEKLGVRISSDPASISLSDERLVGDVQRLAEQWAPDAGITIEPLPTGFVVGGLLDGKRVSTLVELETIAYAKGQVHVVVRTPESVTLEGRRLTQFFAGLVANLFGGMEFVREALSAKLPKQVKWDGRKAEVTLDLDQDGRLPEEFSTLDLRADVTRANGWTSFQLSQAGALTALTNLFMARVMGKGTR